MIRQPSIDGRQVHTCKLRRLNNHKAQASGSSTQPSRLRTPSPSNLQPRSINHSTDLIPDTPPLSTQQHFTHSFPPSSKTSQYHFKSSDIPQHPLLLYLLQRERAQLIRCIIAPTSSLPEPNVSCREGKEDVDDLLLVLRGAACAGY